MTKPKRRRMSKRLRPAPETQVRPWTAQDVRDLLTNPIYGYGIVLQPIDLVPAAVQQFEEQLADEQRARGSEFGLTELDQRFQSFFTALIESGSFTREVDVPPLIDRETWLHAQQVTIGHLARGEPL